MESLFAYAFDDYDRGEGTDTAAITSPNDLAIGSSLAVPEREGISFTGHRKSIFALGMAKESQYDDMAIPETESEDTIKEGSLPLNSHIKKDQKPLKSILSYQSLTLDSIGKNMLHINNELFVLGAFFGYSAKAVTYSLLRMARSGRKRKSWGFSM